VTWKYEELKAAANVTFPRPPRADKAVGQYMGVAAHVFDQDHTQHAFCIDYWGHVHEFWFTYNERRWHHDDLTIVARAPLAHNAVVSYTWDLDQSQHVVFLGVDDHVHELWFRHGRGWNHADLTLAAGAPPRASYFIGFTSNIDRSQRIFYIGADDHVHELRFQIEERRWHHQDLTATAAGRPQRALDRWSAGYSWDLDGTLHVFYVSFDNHVHELWCRPAGQRWTDEDLTTKIGAPIAWTNALAAYTWDVDQTQHVYYQDDHFREIELWFNYTQRQWHWEDLNAASGMATSSGGIGAALVIHSTPTNPSTSSSMRRQQELPNSDSTTVMVGSSRTPRKRPASRDSPSAPLLRATAGTLTPASTS
jgi:hypothetical protein